MRRAFTLIELLVVMAVIATLVAILLPAIGKARAASQRAVSRSNISSLGKVQFSYSVDYKDSFVNPFSTQNPFQFAGYAPGVEWYTAMRPRYEQLGNGLTLVGEIFDGPPGAGRASEMFALYWAPLMTAYLNDNDYASGVTRAPYDQPVIARQKSEVAKSTGQYGLDTGDFDTSYIYSPTCWLSPDRYKLETQTPVQATRYDGNLYLKRNRFDQVVAPVAKAMLFERFDFTRKARGLDVPPVQFNAPEGRTLVCCVDGDVTEVNMSALSDLAESADQATRDTFRPSGMFDISKAQFAAWDNANGRWSVQPGLNTDPWQNGGGYAGNGAYRQFFWATRNGIRGRDLNR